MAISVIKESDSVNAMEFLGLSTDDKPSEYTVGNITYNMNNGALFYEVDTKLTYIYDVKNYNSETGSNWWEV